MAIWERARAKALKTDSVEGLDALAQIRRQAFETDTLLRWEKGLPVTVPEGEE